MSDNDNLFSSSGATTQGEPQAEELDNQNENNDASFLDRFVGDGKKYSSTEELAKAFAAGDSHIKTLETENASFREELARKAGVDEVLQELRSAQSKDVQPEPTPETTAPKGLSEQDVLAMLSARENLASVENFMTNKFGERQTEVMLDKAKSLGVDVEYMKNLATNSPAVFKGLFNNMPEQSNAATTATMPSNTPSPGNSGRSDSAPKTIRDNISGNRKEGRRSIGLTTEQQQEIFRKYDAGEDVSALL